MAFVAVYDANVLYPNTLRDLLIRIAQLPHLVQAKWTEEILEEVAVAPRGLSLEPPHEFRRSFLRHPGLGADLEGNGGRGLSAAYVSAACPGSVPGIAEGLPGG